MKFYIDLGSKIDTQFTITAAVNRNGHFFVTDIDTSNIIINHAILNCHFTERYTDLSVRSIFILSVALCNYINAKADVC